MKVPALATLVLGVALSLPAAQGVQAGYTGVQSCKAADGSSVYTDGACLQMRARPAAMSSNLQLRLSNETAVAMRMGAPQADTAAGGVTDVAEPVPARRSLASGCAHSPTQLTMDLQGSIAAHDVNRLAESYHWVGMSQSRAKPVMQRLEAIADSTVISARFFDARMGPSLQMASNDSNVPSEGVMQLAVHGRGGSQSLEMNVEHYAGCYFVRF